MTYGVTSAGFVVKPYAQILADKQAAVLAALGNAVDLSPPSPMGQLLAIEANSEASLWELAQEAYNAFNRQAVEGAGLDALGDLTGIPREGASFTQLLATLTISAANAPYAAGSLVASVAGSPSLKFKNVNAVTSLMISGGSAVGILFQAITAGNTPSVNAGTLTVISGPVTGWSAVTNPAGQTQLGANAELDPPYAVRQAQPGAQGACTSNATAAALYALAATNLIAGFSANVLENDTPGALIVSGVTLPPHTYAPIVYDPTGTLTSAQIAAAIYANKPAGISSYGTTSATVTDPILGSQSVNWTVPTAKPLFISATVAIRAGFVWANVEAAIQTAFVAAAVALTPANGVPPPGQLGPGLDVIQSQLSAVIQSVPGVYDVQALTFDFVASPSNTAPLVVDGFHVATLAAGTIATNVVLTQGTFP